MALIAGGDADLVRWAYRLVLGREPENRAVIQGWSAVAPREILAAMAASPEAEGCRMAGFPAKGGWVGEPLSRGAAVAAHRLLHGVAPSEPEVAAALEGHRSLLSFRAGFLKQLYGEAVEADPPGGPRRFVLLGQTCTLQGDPGDGYWEALSQSDSDPSAERLARLARAAFPDGGAGRVLVDGGANLGLTALALAAGAPGHAALLCAEPDPRCTRLLRANLAANGLDRARVVEAALGAEDGTATMRLADDNPSVNYVIGERSYAPEIASRRAELPLRRLDTVLAEQGLGRMDLLKIDVEGSESAVMAGAAGAIRRDRPLVFAEFNVWTQMAVAMRNPLEVIEEWHAAFPALVVFGEDDDRPTPLYTREALLWWLHGVLTRRGGLDDLVLCHDLGWMERWA